MEEVFTIEFDNGVGIDGIRLEILGTEPDTLFITAIQGMSIVKVKLGKETVEELVDTLKDKFNL